MFKWIKKKVFESIVKDVVKGLPSLKDKALKYWEDHKDEIIEKAKEAIKKEIRELVEKN